MRVIVQFPDGTFMRRNGESTKNLQEAATWRSRSNYRLNRVPKGSQFIEVELTPIWKCPLKHEGCLQNCGSYGCGN